MSVTRDTSFVRFRVATRLLLAVGICSTLGACVPYVKYQELEAEFGIAKEQNASLQTALSNWEVRVAQEGGEHRVGVARIGALEAKLRGVEQERDSIQASYHRLEEQLQNLTPLPINDRLEGGFNPGVARDLELPLTGGGALVLEDLLFAPGKKTLKSSSKDKLTRLANVLVGPDYSGKVVFIEGHTDNVPVTNSKAINEDNWDLAVKRGHSVFSMLVKAGVPRERFRIIGYGYSVPAEGVTDVNSAEGRARCRRVEIRVGK